MDQETVEKLPLAEKVPLFKRWSYWYALVIAFLLLCIGVFYFLTKHFS
jgi:hypothetical protein